MRRYRVALFLGIAAGSAALAAGPAAASPVEDAWQFGDFQPPGVSSGADVTGSFFLTGTEPWSDPAGNYSDHFDGIEIPLVGYLIHREVFGSSNPSVPDGTTWDGVSLPGFSNTLIVDPAAGIGDQFNVGPVTDTFILDTAGVQDLVSIDDHPPLTLFDFPVDLTALLDG